MRKQIAILIGTFWLCLASITPAMGAEDRATCSVADAGPTCSTAELNTSATEEIGSLYRRVKETLGSVAGTNTITASVTPTLTSLSNGMLFSIKPAVTNTGAVTLQINAISALPVVGANGSALGANDFRSDTNYIIEYYASSPGPQYRVMTSLGAGTAPASGSFVTATAQASLTDERVATEGSAIDITDGGANTTLTFAVDLTELNSATWGVGAFTTLTFNAGAVDPVFTFGSGLFDISAVTAFTLDDEGEMRFNEEDAGGANYKGFKSPAAVTANTTCTFEDDANFIPDSCVGDGSDDDVPEAGADYVNLALSGDVVSAGLVTTIQANSVALTTDTTGNYAAGDAEAGNALTGDTATAFFAAGAIEVARGGTGGAPAGDDQVFVSSSASAGAFATVPDSDGATQKLQYDQTTNVWSAGTDDDVPEAGADYVNLALSGDVVSAGLVSTIQANSVALTTDTTGNYVGDVADGTGIDGTASGEGTTYTPTLDLTELNTATWGTAFTAMTFEAGAVDIAFNFASGQMLFGGVGTAPIIGVDDQGEFRFYEEDAGGANYVSFAAPAAIGTNRTCVLVDGAAPIPDSCVGDGTDAGAGGGDDVTINGGALANPDLDDATPAAASNGLNVKWQNSGSDTSAYVPNALGLKTLSIPGGALVPATTAGCTGATLESTTNKIVQKICGFTSTAADEFGWFQFTAPKSWDEGTITAQFFWTAAAGSGDVVWSMACLARSDDDAMDTALGTAVTVTDTLTAIGDLMISSATAAITVGGTPAENDELFCRVARVGTNGSDTFTSTAQLSAVKVMYSINTLSDN